MTTSDSLSSWRELYKVVRRRFAWDSVWPAGLLVGVVVVYAFVTSAGRIFQAWPAYTHFYDELADGFRAGQLHLLVEPDPRLVKAADPFDVVNFKLWHFDASYYAGKYYVYWGPVPAILQAVAKSLLDINTAIGDQYLVFAAFSSSAVLGILLIQRLERRLFPGVPRGLVVLAMLAFAFGSPVLFLNATAGIYQAAIAGGQAFLLGGMLAAFDAIWAVTDRRRRNLLLLAGACWGLSLACRVSLCFAVALLVVITAIFSDVSAKAPLLRWTRTATWISLPIGAISALLLVYNKLRFDQWLEFGTSIQVTTVKFTMSAEYVAANLYAYLLRPLEFTPSFPFIHSSWNPGRAALADWVEFPRGYMITEPVAGCLLTLPCIWLAPVALIGAARSGIQLILGPKDRRATAYVFCAGAFLVAGSVTGFPEMGLYLATMRYLADFSYGLILLGVLGGFTLVLDSQGRMRKLWASTACLLSLLTITCGLLLGYEGYNKHFERLNPRLHEKIVRIFS